MRLSQVIKSTTSSKIQKKPMTFTWNPNMWVFHKTPTRIHKIPFPSRSHTCPLQIHQYSHLKTRHQITETKSHLSKHVSANGVYPPFDGIWMKNMILNQRLWILYRYKNSKPSSSSLQRRSSSPEATHFLGSQVLFLALRLHRGVPLCALDGFGHADGLRQRVLNDDSPRGFST